MANADGYFVTVGTTSGGNDILDNQDVAGTTFDLPNNLPENTQIFVTLVPYNGVGQATACTEESFTTETVATIPGCTSLVQPQDLAIDVAVSTDISWNAVANADGYYLTVGTTSGGNDILDNQDVAGTTFDLPNDLPENTEIFVTLVPYNGVGNAESCGVSSFITEELSPNPPNCAALVFPENGRLNVAVDTDISWEEVTNADGYFITIGTSSESADIIDSFDVGLTTTFSPNQDLPYNQQLFVTITPYTENVTATDCDTFSFTTEEEPEVESKYGFSPDGDGINDYWTINGIEQYPNNTVMIFNRWGDMVFKMDGYDNSSRVFTGQANQMTTMGAGQLPEGTYYFKLVLPDEHNLMTSQGFLVLKR